MADGKSNPNPPPGYTIDTGVSAASTPPAGYTLDPHPEAKIGPPPPRGSLAWLKSLLYAGADQGLAALPTAGAAGGAVLGGTGGSVEPGPGTLLGGAAGAGLGGGFGKAAEQFLRPRVFPPSKGYSYPATAREQVGEVTGEAGRQAMYEMGGQVFGRGLGALRKVIPAVRSVDGIPLTASERSGNKAVGFVEHMTERSLPSMGPMQRFRDQQSAAIEQKATDLANSFSKSGLTQEQRGQLIQKGMEEGQKAISDEVSSAYQALDGLTRSTRTLKTVKEPAVSSFVDEYGKPLTYDKAVKKPALVGGAPVYPIQSRRAAAALLRELKDEEQLLDPTAIQPLKQRLQHMATSTEPTTFMGAHAARSDIMAEGRRVEELLPNKRGRVTSMLSKAIDADMESAAQRVDPTGSKGILTQLRAANSLSRQQHQLFEQSLVKKVMESGKPEAISSLIRSGGFQETRDLLTVLRRANPQVIGQVRTQVLSDILDDTVQASHGMEHQALSHTTGSTPLQIMPRPTVFRGDVFSKSIHDLGNARGIELYGPDGWNAVKRLASITERVKPNTQDWLSLHNWVYLNALAHPTSRSSQVVAASGGAMRLLAEAMTRPQTVDAMTRYFQRIGRHIPRAIDLFAKEVTTDSMQSKEDQP